VIFALCVGWRGTCWGFAIRVTGEHPVRTFSGVETSDTAVLLCNGMVGLLPGLAGSSESQVPAGADLPHSIFKRSLYRVFTAIIRPPFWGGLHPVALLLLGGPDGADLILA